MALSNPVTPPSGCQPAQTLNDSTVAMPATKQAVDARSQWPTARRSPKRLISSATTSSSIEIAEASAATNSSTKKPNAASVPNGICAKASGSVTNTSPGPLAGSRPYAKTIGNTASPASNEMAVSASDGYHRDLLEVDADAAVGRVGDHQPETDADREEAEAQRFQRCAAG